MCIPAIIDANIFSRFDSDSLKPFRSWIARGDGVIMYETREKYFKEIKKAGKGIKYFEELRRKNLIKAISATQLSM